MLVNGRVIRLFFGHDSRLDGFPLLLSEQLSVKLREGSLWPIVHCWRSVRIGPEGARGEISVAAVATGGHVRAKDISTEHQRRHGSVSPVPR